MKTTNLMVLLIASLFTLGAFAIPHESGSKKAPFAIEIRYISIGTGIDRELKRQIENSLGLKMMTQKIAYIKTSDWGREGESTVCIQFRSYSETTDSFEQIKKLIEQSSEKLTTATLKGDCNSEFITKINE